VLRGEIWVYRPVLERPGQSTLRLIVSADGINRDETTPTVRGLHINTPDPGGLLSVHIDPHGWASAMSSEAVMRRRLVEHVGTATPEQMEAVEVAIAAMYGIPR
jgi:mRNA-degrading endonuclease toxin of MazEF toxin-antitoxin module